MDEHPITRSGVWYCAIGIAAIVAFWLIFIALARVTSYYAPGDLKFFRSASIWQVLTVMDLGTYSRLSPLGFGLIGYLDVHALIPALGLNSQPIELLAVAKRLVWLHPAFLAATCATTAYVTWKLFGDRRIVVIVILLVGLSDTVPFQMRFVTTLVCYLLQIAAVLAIYYLVRLDVDRSRRAVLGLSLCVLGAFSVWEQGLDLAAGVIVALLIGIALRRTTVARVHQLPEASALGIVVAMTAAYLMIWISSAAAEAFTSDKEASYFFSYRNPLPMVDDLLLNFSGLMLQSFRQFLPVAPLSLAVLSKTDMSALNLYNAHYAQFPNMFYRMMGMWYAGIAFACAIALATYAIRWTVRSHGQDRAILTSSLSLFFVGLVTHLPIMHRDYFYIPGFALGFKISVSYMGFVMLIAFLARTMLRSAFFLSLSERGKHLLVSGILGYYCCAAISRAMLGQLPNRFPW